MTPSGRGHTESERGGTPIGRRVPLPRGAAEPITVYINGVQQERGGDYELRDGAVVFTEPIFKEGKISGIRKLTLGLGVVGVYRRHEVVDVEYTINGKRSFASDLEVVPDDPDPPA
jgi:hypothetical protein